MPCVLGWVGKGDCNQPLDNWVVVGYNETTKGVDGKKMWVKPFQGAGGWCKPVGKPSWILAPEPPPRTSLQ